MAESFHWRDAEGLSFGTLKGFSPSSTPTSHVLFTSYRQDLPWPLPSHLAERWLDSWGVLWTLAQLETHEAFVLSQTPERSREKPIQTPKPEYTVRPSERQALWDQRLVDVHLTRGTCSAYQNKLAQGHWIVLHSSRGLKEELFGYKQFQDSSFRVIVDTGWACLLWIIGHAFWHVYVKIACIHASKSFKSLPGIDFISICFQSPWKVC